MAGLLLTNIKQLVNVREQWPVLRGKELAELPCIDNAFLLIEDDTIAAYGPMERASQSREIMSLIYDLAHRALAAERIRVFGANRLRDLCYISNLISIR